MASKLKVAIAGATGETGRSIVDALLESSDKFETFALVRPASVDKPTVIEYSRRGVTIKPVDLTQVSDAVVEALTGLDVVMDCMTLMQAKEQIVLIEASSKAKVGRYVPSFWGPVCPARGVMFLREKKEEFLDMVKRLYIPYTIIDIGWWYQLTLPQLPSGRVPTKVDVSLNEILGDGQTPFACTDNRDIGRFAARIIADPRTLNKMVLCYGEVVNSNQIWDVLEKASGEKIPRVVIRGEDLERIIAESVESLAKGFNMQAATHKAMAEYKYILGIRGDNTPEHAKYLGYLDAKELYPYFKPISFKVFVEEMLEGKLREPYKDIEAEFEP